MNETGIGSGGRALFCARCGQPRTDTGAAFCPRCGTQYSDASSPVPVAATSAPGSAERAPGPNHLRALSLALITVIVIGLAALYGPKFFSQIGAVVTPSCTVGLTGAAVSETIQGLDAQARCVSEAATITDGGTWYVYQGGQAPLGAAICQETYSGDLYTVRDQGSNIYGSGLCANLIKLINGASAPQGVLPSVGPGVAAECGLQVSGHDATVLLSADVCNQFASAYQPGNGGEWTVYAGSGVPSGDTEICTAQFDGANVSVWDSGGALYGSSLCQRLGQGAVTTDPTSEPSPLPTPTLVGSVRVCDTTYGDGSTPGSPAVPSGAVAPTGSGLIFYANNVDHLLGPPGWTCLGSVGMDGSSELSLNDPSDRNSVIDLQTAPACLGCMLDLVCGLFPAAAAADQQQYGAACGPPAGETQHRVSSTVVDFSDPPGIPGSGGTSGGPYETVGAAIYVGQANGGAALLTCALPPASSQCDSIVAEFAGSYLH